MTKLLVQSIHFGFVLILWTPVIVSADTVYPYVVGKAFYSRVLIEVVVGIWLFLAITDSRYRPGRSKILVSVLIYCVIACLATLFGVNPYFSFWSDLERMNGLWDLLHWLLLVIVLASMVKTDIQWRKLFGWNMIVTIFVSLAGLAQLFSISLLPGTVPSDILTDCRVYSTLGNASYLAAVLLVNIFVALGLFSCSNPGLEDVASSRRIISKQRTSINLVVSRIDWFKILCGSTIVLGSVCLLYTGTRASILAVIVVVVLLLFTIWVLRDVYRQRLLVISLMALFGFMGIAFLVDSTIGLPVPGHCDNHATGFRLFSADGNTDVVNIPSWQGEPNQTDQYIHDSSLNRHFGIALVSSGPSFDTVTDNSDFSIKAILTAHEETKRVLDDRDAQSNFTRVLGSLFIREQLWAGGIQAFIARPILGWGTDNFTAAFIQTMPVEFYESNVHAIAFDYPHNKIVGELVTKGLIGAISYLVIWFFLVRTLLRIRREPQTGTMSYAVFGALSGYFIQNLFGFDSASVLLQWSVLIAWVARSEVRFFTTLTDKTLFQSQNRRNKKRLGRTSMTHASLVHRWKKPTLLVVILAATVTALILMNWQPYSSVKVFTKSFAEGISVEERIGYVQESLATSGALNTLPLKTEFDRITLGWINYNEDEKLRAYNFVNQQTSLFLQREPFNSQLLASAIPVLQAGAQNSKDVEHLDYLNQQLQTLAPNRLSTIERKATQSLMHGNYQEALKIVDDFLGEAPYFEEHFKIIVALAKNKGALRQGAND